MRDPGDPENSVYLVEERDQHPRDPLADRLLEIAAAFLRLGCISFGGPVAHLGYLREEFVGKRRWLDDSAYGDLVALCQFLPGPASSQVVFALGMQRAGLLGALVASLCFTLPSAALMIVFAYGISWFGDLESTGWLHGLKLAAVAVVAQAVLEMGRKLCPDRPRLAIAIAASALVLLLPSSLAQVGVILGGGAIGWLIYRNKVSYTHDGERPNKKHHLLAGAALSLFFLLLIFLPVLVPLVGSKGLALFDSFYRAGSLVFGGGHVVLPLLHAEVVSPGWVNNEPFLAGYGMAQALPGPLFTFAAYLGTVIYAGPSGSMAWLGGVGCLFAILLPAWLLIAGTLPFWNQLRSTIWAQATLQGANAAVVGILLAALYNPIWRTGVRQGSDVVVVAIAFGLLKWYRAPAWLVVLLTAAAGYLEL